MGNGIAGLIVVLFFTGMLWIACESDNANAERISKLTPAERIAEKVRVEEYCHEGVVYLIFFGGSHSGRSGASVKLLSSGNAASC